MYLFLEQKDATTRNLMNTIYRNNILSAFSRAKGIPNINIPNEEEVALTELSFTFLLCNLNFDCYGYNTSSIEHPGR